MWSLRTATLAALAASVSMLHGAVDAWLIYPANLELRAFQLRQAAPEQDLPSRIDSYFTGSGFPSAGRTLQQKIDEADEFLAKQFPKTGAVGVGAAVVYQDKVVIVGGHGLRRFNDSSSTSTKDDLFQIGSVSKTFTALGVGLLVDDGKIQWNDPVKKHLPWFKLFDKYAEEHVRIGDLLSMNSGLGRSQDLGLFSGAYKTMRELVEALEYAEPDFALRETTAYANMNFEILGQLIEEVSGKPWHVFLRERMWEPLGMNHTFGAVQDVPVELQQTALNAGHFVCEKNVRGPFAMVNEPSTDIAPSYTYLAAGSIVSSPADMATFLRLVLNKGTVDGVKLFQSPSTISEMITGKNMAVNEFLEGIESFRATGIDFFPDGDSLSAGYGFDLVGRVMWGHAYLDKGGDTFVHHAATGYIPTEGLAVALLLNSEGAVRPLVDQLRAYVMGIFLDIPKTILDSQFQKWQTLVRPPTAPMPGAPACGLEFWDNPPHLDVPAKEAEALVGEYAALTSTKYFPRATISLGAQPNEFKLRMGAVEGTIFYVGDIDTSQVFLGGEHASPILQGILVTPDTGDRNGSYTLNWGGINYRKV